MRRVHIRIEGRVQGVGFRAAAQAEAERLGLSGFVRNLPDGSVEAEVEGLAVDVDAFLTWARTGPPLATVRRIEVTEQAPAGAPGFRILP